MKAIEVLMKERGITKTALAKASGINRVCVSRVINGHERPWPKWRAAMATALDWPLDKADELFEDVAGGE